MFLTETQGDPLRREQRVAAPQQITKLSQAIRIGATYRPQHFGCTETASIAGRSCALGAAEEALTGVYPSYGLPTIQGMELIERQFPGVNTDDIWPKNDFEQWTREQIADWLESQGL